MAEQRRYWSVRSVQYTGRENEGNGLYFYRARYYSPLLGRFINQDPLGFSGSGPDFYTYVGNDLPVDEVRELRVIKNRLSPIKVLAGCGELPAEPLARLWLEIQTRLP